jgi:hypothetical protein
MSLHVALVMSMISMEDRERFTKPVRPVMRIAGMSVQKQFALPSIGSPFHAYLYGVRSNFDPETAPGSCPRA